MPWLWAALATVALAGCSLAPATVRRPAAGVTTGPTTTGPTTSGITTAASPTTASPTTASSAAARLAQARRTHEYPTPVPRPTVAGGWRSPTQAVAQFTAYYINWTAQTVVAHLRALAQVSVGQARSSLTLQAAQTGRDYELRRGGIDNRGAVEAIGLIAGALDQYAVVTREQTTARNSAAYQGLSPAWHVAVATVTRVRGLWVLSAWQPEN
ncbi:MAG: hypothetical protein ACR2NR_16605 [Solirubrobacteraceae bacterium]